MKLVILTSCLLPLLIFFLPNMAGQNSAQDAYQEQKLTTHTFDSAKWSSLTSDLDYNEEQPKQKKKEPNSNGPDLSEFGELFKILVILLCIALLVFLIVKMGGKEGYLFRGNRKIPNMVRQLDLDHIEENLESTDLEDPIRAAIRSEDFPLALRLQYLALLKELSLKNKIRWRREKTNGEYMRELSGSPLLAPMQEATLIFDRVWYGNRELDKAGFIPLSDKLKLVLSMVKEA